MRFVALLVLTCSWFGATGCDNDLDPPWQLEHDRIVAVRATPPAIPAGARSELDALLAFKGIGTSEAPPEAAIVVAPASLASALANEGGRWVVTAPDEARLAAARTELGLAADAPVPLQIGVAYGAGTLTAVKTVWLGLAAEHPTLSAMTIDDQPMESMTELVVGKLVDVRLSIEAVESDDVNWLTSCGTMHDFDLPQAYLRVEEEDPESGQLAVVLRDDAGGVAWRVWPIRAE
ncbi:MAG: hypothetical protein M3680_11190 [Myxococcota bacterium]|nr:hypothetical protein [Myxococcota bacterium]